MRNYGLAFLLLVVVASLITLACGNSPSSARLLESVTVSPATADAQDFPGGQVQFAATGYFTTAPSPVTPLTTAWGACYQGGTTTDILVDANTGTAQCKSGAAGTYTIFTENYAHSGGCTATSACGGGCFVTGTAQLTCP